MKIDPYVKRLETVQNMADEKGVKELAEILMDLLEELTKGKIGFTK